MAYIILIILVIFFIGSFIAYHQYWPKDRTIEAPEESEAFFKESYKDCRLAFVNRTLALSGNFHSVENGSIKVDSHRDDDLYIDWCYLPAQVYKRKLLIINSGLHGIEGYTGSAIQSAFIERFLDNSWPDDTGVLLIHGINPYGFKNDRKVTENNIDLNRNCVLGHQMFDIENEGYNKLYDFFVPNYPVELHNFNNRLFHVLTIEKIVKETMPVMRQAALQGQYKYPNGFYYGGKNFEPQIIALKDLLIEKTKAYQMMVNLDLHTAYGERGKLHLFISRPESKLVEKAVETLFEEKNIDWGDSDDFYTVNGDYVNWANNLVPDVFCIPAVFEFGTMNSQKLFGSIKSLQIMIIENQGHQFGYTDKKNEKEVKELFREMYYPKSAQWRASVLQESYETIRLMLDNLDKMKVEDYNNARTLVKQAEKIYN